MVCSRKQLGCEPDRPDTDSSSILQPVDRRDDFLDYLIEVGVFRRRSDDRVDVSDLYLSGLDLRRKGGVKRGLRKRAATQS